MTRKKRALHPDAPLLHAAHKRPTTRRDFVAQGLAAGVGSVVGGSVLGLFANPRAAYADLSPDIDALRAQCGIAVQGAGKIPFICFDLAGGANIAGSNVLVGKQGGFGPLHDFCLHRQRPACPCRNIGRIPGNDQQEKF